MVATIREHVKQELSNGFATTENAQISVVRILEQIKGFQGRIRRHVEENYVDFIPNHTTSDMYIDEGESLLRETENILKNIGNDARLALSESNIELSQCLDELREVSLGLKVSYRILKIDDLFQCLEESNAAKDYLVVLDLLGKLKSFICSDNSSDIDRLFQKCECYDTIKVKYHIQANILQQNLQQKFDRLVQFSEKSFPSAKNVTLCVSKDTVQLQDTVMALFQARYNPVKLCDFLLDNCLLPMVKKPVSVDYFTESEEYDQLNISYSQKNVNQRLRPSYKQVFTHVKLLFDCLANINVNVSAHQRVFGIIGSHIKEKFLIILVQDCLMHAIPETMDEYQESTLLEDVQLFERTLADTFFIDSEQDRAISDFIAKYETLFKQRFCTKLLENARVIMQKDLQDMSEISEVKYEELKADELVFPQCMISKSVLELVKLMERILRQPVNMAATIDSEDPNGFLFVIPIIINMYCSDVPKIHEKLLESIPQQSTVFYNNCMFLAHWVAKNSKFGIPTQPALLKILQSTGLRIFQSQELQQQQIISQILKDLDVSDTHSIGSTPLKLIRQCLRQMDLLKNVWLNVLPESIYNDTFCTVVNVFCQDIIKRILCLEDISATVASELSELIEVILERAPGLFKEKHGVMQVPSWMKLQQMHIILNASLQEITEQWCDGAGILTANYNAEEIRRLIRALFQNTDRRAKALSRIV